jgi:carboxymethylenebutenolidase
MPDEIPHTADGSPEAKPTTARSWTRVVLRITLAAAVVLLALAALIVGSIWLDERDAAAQLRETANTSVPGTTGPDVSAYVASPSSTGPRPAVVMVHEFWGLNADMRDKAELLSTEEGYTVVAPDVFRGRSADWLPSAIWQVSTADPVAITEDLDAVLAWARSQPDVDPDRIAIVGFCFGGRAAMLYSMHDPTLEATVVFYGNPVMDAERLRALEGPVLGIFGESDRSIPLEDVSAFRASLAEAGVESTVTVYPGQGHAFVDSVESIEAGGPQGAAWNEMRVFLRDAFTRSDRSPGARATPVQPTDDRLGWSYIVRLGLSHARMEGPEHSER